MRRSIAEVHGERDSARDGGWDVSQRPSVALPPTSGVRLREKAVGSGYSGAGIPVIARELAREMASEHAEVAAGGDAARQEASPVATV